MGTFTNSENLDEMPHNVAFHQDLHCLLRLKQPSGTERHDNLEKSTCEAVTLIVYNGHSHTYCINVYGKIHQSTKG